FPRIWMSRPLWATAWLSLPIAILPSGTRTAAVMPACAAYAAADAEVFPVEAQMTASAPCSTARERATVIPRSLKEPVGFIPSNVTHTSAPVRRDRAGAGSSGVPPSPRVTTVDSSVTPSRSAYSRSTPRQRCAMSVSFHPQHRGDPFDDVALGESFHGVAEVLLTCTVCSDDEACDGLGRGLAGHGHVGIDLFDGLLDRRHRDTALAEDAGDRRQHPLLVVDLEGDLVAR